MIEIAHLYKSYASGNHALKNINLKIERGEFVFLTGPSGAGKSTLFKMLTAFDKPTSGHIKVGSFRLETHSNQDLPLYRRSVGIVFQDFKLLQDKTVFENVALPLKILKASEQQIKNRVFEVLRLVELENKFDTFPEFMSGGEQQRVAIARAIVHRPQLIVADEPTGNLDPELSNKILDLFEKVCSQGTTVVIATHDLESVKQRNKKQIRLKNGQIVGES